MNQTFAVKSIRYPKRITRDDKNKTFGLLEPTRKNMYDTIMENLDISNRKTFVHRLIIVGEHSLAKDEQILEIFSDSVKQGNAVFHYEKVTGILLYYSKYFVHMVEGDEDSIQQQLKFLRAHRLFDKLGSIKVLMQLPHIKQRFFHDWSHYFGHPAKLLGRINVDCSITETGRHVYTCLRKFYNFVIQFVEDNYDEEIFDVSSKDHKEDSDMCISFTVDSPRDEFKTRLSTSTLRSSVVGMNIKEPYRVNLPEIELIDFILKSTYTQTLDAYCSLYIVVPQRYIYKDKVWPIPSDFVPYDIFMNPYNIVMELTKGGKNESVQEEMEKAPTSKSSVHIQDDANTASP